MENVYRMRQIHMDKIINKNVKLEYLEIRNKLNLSKKINKKNFKIFIAYYINGIRLIDNY